MYYLGADDGSHLQASKPQDHCPFSVTGWPVAHPYPWVTAMDIMPPKPGSGLPSLQRLGTQMIADRQAGHPGMAWLKYINHEPDRDNGGPCWHHSWQPNYARVSSSDRGHIHASGRSDMVTAAGAAGTYDPVSRIRGGVPESTSTPGVDMPLLFLATIKGSGIVRLVSEFTTNRVVSAKGLPVLQAALKANSLGTAVWEWDDTPEYRELLGVNIDSIDDPVDVTLTPQQLADLGVQIRQGVPSLDQIRGAVDEELDEQSRGGADSDGP